MTVGERIKEIRMKLGMSQVDFADKINVSKQTLYKYENNIITNIPSDKIEAAADLGNVSPSYILGWDKNKATVNLFTGNGTIEYISKSEKALLELYNLLNDFGKKEAYKRLEELTLIDRYSMSSNHLEVLAAHERTDIKVTDEMRKHDKDIMMDDSEWEWYNDSLWRTFGRGE